MKKNIYLPKETVSKTEEIREIKDEVPSFEEFLKNWKPDERVSDSYESEINAETIEGPQYGPGKKNFGKICENMKKKQKTNTLTCRISCHSDDYKEGKDYVCAIIYAVNNEFTWTVKKGEAKGHHGKGFYAIIKSTEHLKRGQKGKGLYHHSLVLKVIGVDPNNHHVSGGGFSFHNGQLKFNSVPLNKNKADTFVTDGNKKLSKPEEKLARLCWEEYKANGKNHTFSVNLDSIF